jgi:hypothetical protein
MPEVGVDVHGGRYGQGRSAVPGRADGESNAGNYAGNCPVTHFSPLSL